MADYAFHPDALPEYADATTYYLREASATVAEGFVARPRSHPSLVRDGQSPNRL